MLSLATAIFAFPMIGCYSFVGVLYFRTSTMEAVMKNILF